MKENDELNNQDDELDLINNDYQYFYDNDFVDNYEFKQRNDLDTVVPLKFYTDTKKQLNTMTDVFPEFEEEILNIGLPLLVAEAGMLETDATLTFLPMNEAKEDIYFNVTDPKLVASAKQFQKDYLELLNRIEQKYTKEEYPVQNRIVNYAKKHAEFIAAPDALDLLSGFPEYVINSSRSMLDMPNTSFKTANGQYESDTDRWVNFMQNHDFLNQAEECQNFFLNSYVPYARKMRAGNLTPEDAESYNLAYASHLLKQKEYFEKITAYTHDDPEIAANKVCNDNGQFEQDWKGDRFGKATLNQINENLRLLDNGWPAADITFLNQLKMAKESIDDAAKNKGKVYNKDEIRAAKQLQKKMKKAYDDIMNKPLLTPEDRMARLEAIEDSIKDYNTFDKAYKTRHHGRDNHKLGDSSLTWLFDETKGRTVFPTEVGKNKVYESHIQSTFANQVSSITSDITFCLTAKELDDFTKSPMYDQFTDGNSRIFSNALYGQGQKTKSLAMSFGNPVQLRVVKNPEAYKKLIDDVSKLGEFGEKNILDKIENDDIGLQMKDYIRARIVNPAKRIVKGKGSIYLESKTPLGLGINQMAPQVPTDIENDKLRNNIKKWQHRFPVYSLYVECDKQLNTFADYYTEKEKAGGTLSPEREKYYRQKIYDHTVAISPLFNKVMSSVENPAINAELKQDKVLQDSPFNIHPLSARGCKSLASSLEAYKVGLENGWSLDDTALLAAFNNILYTKEADAAGNGDSDLSKYEKYDNPQYRSASEKSYVEKMRKLYDDIKKNPLKSGADRDKYIDKMNQMVQYGLDKGYLMAVDKSTQQKKPLNTAAYYNQLKYEQFSRNISIGTGKAAAYHPESVQKGSERQLEIIMSDITAPRTDKWWSSESPTHEKLRLACEDLQDFMKKHPNKIEGADDKLMYAAEYLAKLDAVQHYSKLYQDKRADSSTLGGKARLAGSREIWNFAETEKDSLVQYLKTVDMGFEFKFNDIEELRMILCETQRRNAGIDISDFMGMPQDKEGQKLMTDRAATILTYRLANTPTGKKAMNELGTGLMKEEIMNSSDFKSMMKSFYKDKTMTPEKLCEELSLGENLMNRIKGTNKQLKKVETKAKEISDKKQAAENKRLAKKMPKTK